MEKNRKRTVMRSAASLMAVIILWGMLASVVYAAEGKTEVPGKVYEFDKDSHYVLADGSNCQDVTEKNTYGMFFIRGNIADVGSKDGVIAYKVEEGNLELFYNYRDSVLKADLDSWHLVDDKSKQVNHTTLDADILKGAMIIQTSKDRINWVNVATTVNAFSDVPVRTDSIYTTKDVQLINGCFYRVVIAYELRIRTEDSNFLFINTDSFAYKKVAEVYEFYAYTDSAEDVVIDPNYTYRLGSRVRVKQFDGYSGEDVIEKNDAHYNWDLGDFFVTGYTDKVVEADGDHVVFLKNVGDKVTLWFNLIQDINRLPNKDNLSITADTEGYDQQFETVRMNFGRGALIIRYTDHNNNKGEPIIYTNYLEANATVGANTKVQLFEEGDYEVALDYQVTEDQLIDEVGHYRIAFTFSVRNGNCMVYPYDVKTRSELSTSSITENGFYLDLARSRYLKVNIKREVLKDSADGLVEDTRFNGPAKEGMEYTEEGIYTITVANEYTGQITVKKIYVGTNSVMKAHMTMGLSIPEINSLVAQGAQILADGTIYMETATPVIPESTEPTQTEVPEQIPPEEKELHTGWIVAPAAGAVLVGAGIGVAAVRRKNSRKENAQTEEETEE